MNPLATNTNHVHAGLARQRHRAAPLFLPWLCASVLLGLLLAPAGSQAETAFEAVEESTALLIDRLQEVQPLYEEDPARFFAEIDIALSPYIDFEGFSKGVMAKHYRKATEVQRQTFQQQFRGALIKTYAKALASFDSQGVDVTVLPPNPKQAGLDKATIRLQVRTQSGDVYPVQYQLHRQDGKWRLRNVIVNGINIGLQFRSQFSAFMQRYKNDIDEVIANWSVDV